MKDEGHDHAHSSPIKTPKQLVVVIVLSFLIPILGIILLTQFVLSGKAPSPAALDTEAIAERVKPVADVVLSGSAEATAEQRSEERRVGIESRARWWESERCEAKGG